MNWFVAIAERNAVVERERKMRDGETMDEFRARIAALPPQTVMERLEAIECEVFYPKARIVRQRLCKRSMAPVRETVWVPVFGRYLFAKGRPEAIRETRGILGLVNNADGEPGVLSEELIEDMRRRYRNYKIAQKLSEVSLKPGQTVRIMDGPMRGWDAKVKLADLSRGLLTAVREAMGREIPIQNLRIEDVEVVG